MRRLHAAGLTLVFALAPINAALPQMETIIGGGVIGSKLASTTGNTCVYSLSAGTWTLPSGGACGWDANANTTAKASPRRATPRWTNWP